MCQKVFPANIDSLYIMLKFIKAYGKKHAISSLALDQITLAAEEALVNIISYGYPEDKKGIIGIACEKTILQPGIKIIIKDQGVPFNPIEKAPMSPPLSDTLLNETETSLGGYGIYILIKLMDKVEYQRFNNENVLTLIKYATND